MKRSTTEQAAIVLAYDRGLISAPSLDGEEWIAVLPVGSVDDADLDADSAVVAYERVPGDSRALAVYRAA